MVGRNLATRDSQIRNFKLESSEPYPSTRNRDRLAVGPPSPTMPVTMSLNVSRSPTHSPTSIIYGQQMSYRGPDGAMRDFIAKKTADQIRQGNIEHMAKIASVKPVIDDDVEDEATGEARKEMAAASAARRAAEEEARKAEVKEYYARLKAKTTVIDDEMDTEAAAIARAEFAAASRARRAAEAAEIHRENEELKQRLSQIKPQIDMDITDEVAGEAREKRAAENMARRQAKIEKLKAENLEMRRRIEESKAKTDDDVTDDAMTGGGTIGDLRNKVASDSKERKAKHAAKVNAENAALASRIKKTKSKTNDGDGTTH